MDKFLQRIGFKTQNPNEGGTAPINRYEGFTPDGRIILSDQRGTKKAQIPEVHEKSVGDDPLAIYRPTGAKHVDAAKAMAAFTGWTFAAVNAIASEVSNIQWRLYMINGKQHEEQEDHELLDILECPNEDMTGIELKYTTVSHLELAGNCYWLLDGVKNELDKPTAIYLLHPGRVRVKLDKSRYPYRIDHYEFTIDGKLFRFEKYQILHIKYPDPNDPYVGIGIPQTIPVWIDSDNYAMEYNRKFFQNGASIGLYISTDTNVDSNIERIKKGWSNNYAGNENAHKTPVLPKGTKLEHTGVTHKDMDYGNLTLTTRDRILAGFRVSKTILGTAESDTNRATAETADYVFSKRTIKPKMLMIISYINEFFVPRYGEKIYLTFIDPVPEDKAARTEEMKTAVGAMPVITQNEARKNFMGLGPVEGGEKLYVPSLMTIAGQSATPEGEDQTPHLAKAVTASGQFTNAIRTRAGGKTIHSKSQKIRESLAEAFKKALEDKTDKQVHKSIKDLTDAEYSEHWKRFANRSDKAAADLEQIFKRINKSQKADVIKNLPESTGVKKAIIPSKFFDLDEWIQLTVDLSLPILLSLTRDEAAAALSMIGADHIDILANESIANAVEAGVEKMARSYNETTVDQLTEVITEKLTQNGGTNLPEITAAVDDVYDFADSRRAGLIAKTESFRAGNYANKAAWKASNVVKSVKWYTAEDNKVCPFCVDMNGKSVGIDENFFDEGDEITGKGGKTMTANYGDVEAPPLHPNCRCYIRPDEISID